jgi:hypothetical protein
MEPMLNDTLRKKIQALSADAVRIRLGPEIRLEWMKVYILRIARQLNVPVTVRKVTGGLLCWRSSDEDVQQAREAATLLGRVSSFPRLLSQIRFPDRLWCGILVDTPSTSRHPVPYHRRSGLILEE